MGIGFLCCCGGCTISFGGTARVCSTSSALAAGAVVTVKDHATGTVLGTATANGSGVYSGSYTGTAGTVDVVVTLGNGTVTSSTLSFACGPNTVPLLVVPVAKVAVGPQGCFGGIPSAAVAFTLSGVTTTVTTDGTGNATAYLKTGTYSYTVTASRYTTATGSFAVNTGTNCAPIFNPTLGTATGYACLCHFPVATTLFGTLSGDCTTVAMTFTYNGTSAWVSADFAFQLPNDLSSCWANTTGVTLNATAKITIPAAGTPTIDWVSGDNFGCRAANTIGGVLACTSGPPAFAGSVDFGTSHLAGVCQVNACSNAMTLALTE